MGKPDYKKGLRIFVYYGEEGNMPELLPKDINSQKQFDEERTKKKRQRKERI